jgi:hypothetical protein
MWCQSIHMFLRPVEIKRPGSSELHYKMTGLMPIRGLRDDRRSISKYKYKHMYAHITHTPYLAPAQVLTELLNVLCTQKWKMSGF